MAAEIDLLIFLVDAADVDDVEVAGCYLAYEFAVEAIEVDVVEAIFLASDEE